MEKIEKILEEHPIFVNSMKAWTFVISASAGVSLIYQGINYIIENKILDNIRMIPYSF